jgi:D-alanine transaminase
VITRNLSAAILSGITRLSVLQFVQSHGLVFEERRFSVAEAKEAAEAFLTSTTSLVLPVTRIDGQAIGDGQPGPLTLKLREGYLRHLAAPPS